MSWFDKITKAVTGGIGEWKDTQKDHSYDQKLNMNVNTTTVIKDTRKKSIDVNLCKKMK